MEFWTINTFCRNPLEFSSSSSSSVVLKRPDVLVLPRFFPNELVRIGVVFRLSPVSLKPLWARTQNISASSAVLDRSPWWLQKGREEDFRSRQNVWEDCVRSVTQLLLKIVKKSFLNNNLVSGLYTQLLLLFLKPQTVGRLISIVATQRRSFSPLKKGVWHCWSWDIANLNESVWYSMENFWLV